MEIEQLITYFLQGGIVLWTVRLARSRGQHPWLWGAASILLMTASGLLGLSNGTLPAILGMLPMVILLFFKKTAQGPTVIPEDRVICPKCQAYHATGHNFCVNCGWQLDQPYAAEGTAPPDSTPEDSRAAQPEPAATLASEAPAEPIPAIPDQAEEPATATVIASEPVDTAASVEEPSHEPVVVEPMPAEPPPKPVFRFPLTAAGLTERGVSLFTEDRVQEAVDQFTKAIALDPDYRPAWTKRAEAYLRLGLRQKAEEDQRRLEGI